jgi:hypothetical protein
MYHTGNGDAIKRLSPSKSFDPESIDNVDIEMNSPEKNPQKSSQKNKHRLTHVLEEDGLTLDLHDLLFMDDLFLCTQSTSLLTDCTEDDFFWCTQSTSLLTDCSVSLSTNDCNENIQRRTNNSTGTTETIEMSAFTSHLPKSVHNVIDNSKFCISSPMYISVVSMNDASLPKVFTAVMSS